MFPILLAKIAQSRKTGYQQAQRPPPSSPSSAKTMNCLGPKSAPFINRSRSKRRSPWPSKALRGHLKLPLQFSVTLRGPPWFQRSCRCSTSRPFVALRGLLKLPLQFSVTLRGPPWFQRSCRCSTSRPFAALRGLLKLPLQFSVTLRGPPWFKRSCRCSTSRPFVALRGLLKLPLQFSVTLRGPPWFQRSCRCRCSSPRTEKRLLPASFRTALRKSAIIALSGKA